MPTEELKRFWEWCGFKWLFGGEWRYEEFKTTNGWWESPTGKRYLELPPIDLNNLFKWAMTKLDQANYYKALSSIFLKQEDPALALFWAINKVIKED